MAVHFFGNCCSVVGSSNTYGCSVPGSGIGPTTVLLLTGQIHVNQFSSHLHVPQVVGKWDEKLVNKLTLS